MNEEQHQQDMSVPTRRRLLQMGAIGAAAVVTVRPAMAQTTASLLTCQIPIPSGQYIAADGTLVAAGTPGAVPGGVTYTGEAVKAALNQNYTLPGATYDQHYAHLAYIRRLQSGQAGFTCYASLQMPR
jgi:hypothetical protein